MSANSMYVYSVSRVDYNVVANRIYVVPSVCNPIVPTVPRTNSQITEIYVYKNCWNYSQIVFGQSFSVCDCSRVDLAFGALEWTSAMGASSYSLIQYILSRTRFFFFASHLSCQSTHSVVRTTPEQSSEWTQLTLKFQRTKYRHREEYMNISWAVCSVQFATAAPHIHDEWTI